MPPVFHCHLSVAGTGKGEGMRKKKSIWAILIIIAAAVGIVAAVQYLGIGATSQGWRIGYTGRAEKHIWAAQYIQLDGTMKRTMRAKDDIKNLHIEVETTEGSLGIIVQNTAGDVIFSEENIGNQTFDIETPDQVVVQIEGKKHKGKFHLSYEPVKPPEPLEAQGMIFLYGVEYDSKPMLDEIFQKWQTHYEQDKMRHLFVELPDYTAELLNIWLREEDNQILNDVYEDWYGTDLYSQQLKRFYHKIKEHCPETVFHGTDVGHEYATTGARYLNDLRTQNMEDTDAYQRALEIMEQGKRYYESADDAYRENMMTENFIQILDTLKGANVMAIYGSAHLSTEVLSAEGNFVPCMTEQLKEHYGDRVQAQDLTRQEVVSSRTDQIQVAGKTYEASYFGIVDLSVFAPEFRYQEFWRLENAYADFEHSGKTGNVLPYRNFPMPIEQGQVIVVDYVKADGSTIRQYYRTDGNSQHGEQVAEEIIIP